MQVNNNFQSPNFGMALKVNNGAKKALENLNIGTIEKLQKAGIELKDTKYYHLKVDNDLSAKIVGDKDAYFGKFRNGDIFAVRNGVKPENGLLVSDSNIIMIENPHGTIAGVAKYVQDDKKEAVIHAWGLTPYNSVRNITELSKITKLLDDVAVQKYTENLQKAAEETTRKGTVSKAVTNLLNSFGE